MGTKVSFEFSISGTSQQHMADDYANQLAICQMGVQISFTSVINLPITIITFLDTTI